MAWNQLYVVLFNNWRRRPATTKRRLRRRLDSWERLGSAFVAAPPLSKYSKLFIPRRPFLSSGTLFVPSHFIQAGGKIALRATEQTVEKGACHLYSVPRRTCLFFYFFLFQLQAVELRVWCQKAELIALSQRGGPPITKRSPKCLLEIIKAFPLHKVDKYWAAESAQLRFQPFIYGFKSFQGKIVDVLLALSQQCFRITSQDYFSCVFLSEKIRYTRN